MLSGLEIDPNEVENLELSAPEPIKLKALQISP